MPLQDTALPAAHATHLWVPADEQWRRLKAPRKRQRAAERPAGGTAEAAGRRGVPEQMPAGWTCEDHLSSGGIRYKRYRGPHGQRAQSIRDAWRKLGRLPEGQQQAAGEEAEARASTHGGELPVAAAAVVLTLAVRDDGSGPAVAAAVLVTVRARKQRIGKDPQRSHHAAPAAAAGGASPAAAASPAALAVRSRERGGDPKARRAARRAVAAVLTRMVRQVEREHRLPQEAAAAAAAAAVGAAVGGAGEAGRSGAAASSDTRATGRGRVKGSPATACELFLQERRQELQEHEPLLSRAELHARTVHEWRQPTGKLVGRRVALEAQQKAARESWKRHRPLGTSAGAGASSEAGALADRDVASAGDTAAPGVPASGAPAPPRKKRRPAATVHLRLSVEIPGGAGGVGGEGGADGAGGESGESGESGAGGEGGAVAVSALLRVGEAGKPKRSRLSVSARRWSWAEEEQLRALAASLPPGEGDRWGVIAERLATGRSGKGISQHWTIMQERKSVGKGMAGNEADGEPSSLPSAPLHMDVDGDGGGGAPSHTELPTLTVTVHATALGSFYPDELDDELDDLPCVEVEAQPCSPTVEGIVQGIVEVVAVVVEQ